jgi:ubiquinone/menaquinone biosynthesis C-methylase UbiE
MERADREAEFHDRAFAEGTRSATDRFYAVARRAYDRYGSLVREGADGLRVLEYGCGPGSESVALARAGARVHGIDISPVAIEMARVAAKDAGVGDRCRFDVMNAEALALDDESFDRVCGSGILHHLDLSRAFAEVARVLAPGGRAIFIEPLGHNPIINWYRRRTPEMRTADEHPLVARDLTEAARHFRRVTPEFHQLGVLAAAFVRSARLQRALEHLDDLVLARRSPLRWAAWMTILVLEK